MARKKIFPTKIDGAGNIVRRTRDDNNDLDYTRMGIDGEERISFPGDPFGQGSEYDFNEFH